MDSTRTLIRRWIGVLTAAAAVSLIVQASGLAAEPARKAKKPGDGAANDRVVVRRSMEQRVAVTGALPGSTPAMHRSICETMHAAAVAALEDLREIAADAPPVEFTLSVEAKGSLSPAGARTTSGTKTMSYSSASREVLVGVRNGKYAFTLRTLTDGKWRTAAEWSSPMPDVAGTVTVTESCSYGYSSCGSNSFSVSSNTSAEGLRSAEGPIGQSVRAGLLGGIFKVEYDKYDVQRQAVRPGSSKEAQELTSELKITNQSPWRFENVNVKLLVQPGVTHTLGGITLGPGEQSTQTTQFKFKRVKGTRAPILRVIDVDKGGK